MNSTAVSTVSEYINGAQGICLWATISYFLLLSNLTTYCLVFSWFTATGYIVTVAEFMQI